MSRAMSAAMNGRVRPSSSTAARVSVTVSLAMTAAASIFYERALAIPTPEGSPR
jgi:hypothetical protein